MTVDLHRRWGTLLGPVAEPTTERDLRLVPTAVLTWAAVGASLLLGAVGSVASAVAAVVLIIAGQRLRLLALTAAGATLIPVAASAGLQLAVLESSPVREAAQSGAGATMVVRLTQDAVVLPAAGGRGEFAIRQARLTDFESGGRRWRTALPVTLTASGDRAAGLIAPVVGTTVRVRVSLSLPERLGDRSAAVGRLRSPPSTLASPSPVADSVEHIRAGLRESVAGQPAERRGLVPALVVGDMTFFPDGLDDAFEATALTHLTAVSGANLTLMLALVLTLARWAGLTGWWLRAVGPLGVAAFVVLCRAEPSVVRAAAMGLVGLAGLGVTGGRARGIRSLSVAVIVLLVIDPWLGLQWGFVLSVLATGGIVCWAGPWSERLALWLPRPLAEAFCVALAAQLATQPVVTALSGQVSLVGLAANVLAAPLVGPATVLGFTAAGLSVIHPWPAAVAGSLAGWCAQGIIWIATYGSQLPGAVVEWPTSTVALIGLGTGCLIVAWLAGRLLRHRWLTVGMAILLLLALLRPVNPPGWPPREWAVVGCEVGQGDGLVIDLGGGAAIVVDTGPEAGPIRTCLDQLQVRTVPLLMLSHSHADHVGGIEGVFGSRRTVGTVLVSAASTGNAEVARQLAGHGLQPRTVRRGDRFAVAGASVEILAPLANGPVSVTEAAPGSDSESGAENDASIVARIATPELTVLATGDLEPAGQSQLLAAGASVRADVLKVPHHGSSRQDEEFLAATGARVALIGAGEDNDYGHPAPSTVTMLRSMHMTVLSTDRSGAIAVVADEGGLSVATQDGVRP
ncbi:ComEC/Rec2 family competence protein [Naumannella halotolerans]|uniref:Competence protein ComEC n=1 Tax=Naumannella halotolerans TaxID=993414 RepID=A0A4R7J9D2_9ACTN|nr:ComEC/Rec2 family competence protein [Naumannella halotolerans]TDT33914.1 competence protein ComEC [Naumannella halotolerans]